MNTPPKSNSNQVIAQHTRQVTFSGPIPPPEILAKYEELKPGFAERIIKMAEEQGKHRRLLETDGLQGQIQHTKSRDLEAKFGQWFAFILTVLTIVAGAYLVIKNHQISGTIFGGMGLAVIVTAFIYGTKKENK